MHEARPAAARRRRWLAAVLVALAAAPLAGQQRELIVDILTTPNRYWNRTVVVRGHVRAVMPNPPGTSRGMYVLRDTSDQDIMVATGDLPVMGREYTITAKVEQRTPDSVTPVLLELRRAVGVASPRPPASVPAPPAQQPAAPQAQAPAAAPAAQPQPSAPVADDGFQTTLLYGLLAAVALLSVAMIVAFWPRRRAAVPPPAPAARPQLSVHAVPAAPFPALSPARPEPAGGKPTEVVPPRAAAPAVKGTEIFRDLGAELSIVAGPDRGRSFPITKPRVLIGRSGGRQNDLTLNDDTVSREHARITHTASDDTFRLLNESITNPVLVNGTAADGVTLGEGDEIRLGATTLRFQRSKGRG